MSCSRCVDVRALSGEHLKTDATVGEIMHRLDQVTQVSAESVQLPDQERNAMAQRLEAGRKVRTVVLPAGRLIRFFNEPQAVV